MRPSTADCCDKSSREELPPSETKARDVFVKVAKERVLGAWRKFDGVSTSMAFGDTRLVLSWETADGRTSAPARLVAQGLRGPDLEAGVVGTASKGGTRGVSELASLLCRRIP